LYDLRLFGFEELSNICLKLMEKDLELGHSLLGLYHYYLVDPCLHGLLSTFYLSDKDRKAIQLLRLKPEEIPAPFDFSLATEKGIKCDFVSSPDPDDVRGYLKRGPDDELSGLQGEFQEAATSYDLKAMIEAYEKLGEVITERINEERKS